MRFSFLLLLFIYLVGHAQTIPIKMDTLPSPGYAPYSYLEIMQESFEGEKCKKEIFFSIDRDSLFGYIDELFRPQIVIASGKHRICFRLQGQSVFHCEEFTFYPSEKYRLYLGIDCKSIPVFDDSKTKESNTHSEVQSSALRSKPELKKIDDNNKEGSRWVGKSQSDSSLKGYSKVILYLQTPDGSVCRQSAKLIIDGKDTLVYVPGANGAMDLNLPPGIHSLICISKWFNTLNFQRIETGSNQAIEIFGRFQGKGNNIPQPVFNYDKPVIYLYPVKEELVSLKLTFDGELGFTWPTYTGSWDVRALPGGEIFTSSDTVRYLFWEGNSSTFSPDSVLMTGFIISRSEMIPFLNKSLSVLGLNSIERADFLTYWIPQLQKHEKVFVHFISGAAYEKMVPLNVSPTPDSRIRIFMCWRPVEPDEKLVIEPQQLKPIRRSGFSLIEWGGGRMPETKIN